MGFNKKVTGRIKSAIFLLFVVVMLFISAVYWYVTTQWKNYYSEIEVMEIVNEINASPQLPEVFYAISDKVSGIDRHHSLTYMHTAYVFNEIILHKNQPQYSAFTIAARRIGTRRSMGDYSSFKFAWALEKYGTSEKCFDYAIIADNRSLREEDPTVADISNSQDTTAILEFLIMYKNPSHYRHKPELLQEKVAELRWKLLQQ